MGLRVTAPRDFAAGIVFFLIGAAFLALSLGMRIGSARTMGPGYLPSLLSAGLVLVGLGLVVRSLQVVGNRIEPIAWRKLAAVLAAICIYAGTVHGAGFVPAIFLLVAVSALANPAARPVPTTLTGLGLAGACWLVFTQGLGLNLPAFGPWLGF